MHRRSRALMLAASIATTVAFGTLPAGGATAAGAPRVPELQSCTADAELSLGSMGESVSCLQTTLAMLSVYHGRINGIYDQVTADAVRWVQINDPDLRDDGVAGPNTLTALGIWSGVTNPPPPPPCTAAANISAGETGPDVSCLQTTLVHLGVFIGEADGIFGPATLDAVTRYQANNAPLVPDGIAGPRTLAAMGIWNGMNEGATLFGTPAGPGPWPAPLLDLPEYRLTFEGVPFYGNRTACTLAQADTIAAQFARDGADVATQQWAVYIASREGGCNYLTVNINPATRDDSHCTFQINALSGTFEAWGELGRRGWTTDSIKASLDACADAASDLWVYCGRGPWMPPYYCQPPWQGATPTGPPIAPPVTTPPTTPATTPAETSTSTTRPPRSTTTGPTKTTQPPQTTEPPRTTEPPKVPSTTTTTTSSPTTTAVPKG